MKIETNPDESSQRTVRAQRKTFVKAFKEEEKSWRWETMTADQTSIVVAFCACVHLRMQGTSMDEVMNPV